jgi:hypothetical protein
MAAHRIVLVAVAAALTAGCAGAVGNGPPRPPAAEKWFKRAQQDYGDVRIEEAHDALEKAYSLAPQDEEIRLLGGRIALARLEYDESLQMLRDLPGSEAHGLRGRAHWYKGDLAPAADELEAMLEDPEVRDDWAKSIASLSRIGEARSPFTTTGARVAAVEMAHVSPAAPYLVIPVEIDGEQALAMLSTGMAEVVIDSSSRAEPSWVSIRFGGTLEVSDVPALSQDLSGVSKELNAPIKALIGVNLLRHVNATIDYAGHQFVARAYAPPPPPNATRLNLFYARGGGMMVSTPLGAGDDARAALFVDSSMRFPLALDERGWIKAGVSPADLKPVEGDTDHKLKQGVVPLMRIGAFDVHGVPAVLGAPIPDIEKGLRFDIDGVIGSPVLAQYRITLADGGRMMWVEDDSAVRALLSEPEDDLSQPVPEAPGDLPPGPLPGMGQPPTGTQP